MATGDTEKLPERKPSGLTCTFCKKRQSELACLVAAPPSRRPAAYICNECINLAVEILIERGDPVDAIASIRDRTLEELGLQPVFARSDLQARRNHCFYLGPFAEPFNTVYSDHVVPALRGLGMTVERADEIFSTDVIIEDVWRGINAANFVIADVTSKNPNVLYEVGMAHTVGKPVVLVTQDMADVPFDLRHRRCVVYEYTPRGCARLEEQLKGTAEALINSRPVVGSGQ